MEAADGSWKCKDAQLNAVQWCQPGWLLQRNGAKQAGSCSVRWLWFHKNAQDEPLVPKDGEVKLQVQAGSAEPMRMSCCLSSVVSMQELYEVM
eukprot:1159931-Pelagomonas_calceolata.AAC.8